MTKIQDILSPHRVLVDCHISSKKRALELLSKMIAEDLNLEGVTHQDILHGFLARERLGSTVITKGIAVPHTRLAQVERPIGAFIKLHEPIAFDNHDEHNVSMLFGLVMPENNKQEHISVLSCLAECFQCQTRIAQLNDTHGIEEAYRLLTLCQADVVIE